MTTIKLSYDARSEESVKKVFNTLYVFYEGNTEAVLQALDSNAIATANADAWITQNRTQVDIITPWAMGAVMVRLKQCRDNGVVYNIIQTHTVNDPNAAPATTLALFRPAPVIAPGRLYPLWSSIGLLDSENYWKLGDVVDHNGEYWTSGVDVNVWEPGADGIGSNIWAQMGAEPGGGNGGGEPNPCEGVAAWTNAQHWSTYMVGDRRTDGGKLWECHNPQWAQSYAPSSSYGYLAWNHVADCAG